MIKQTAFDIYLVLHILSFSGTQWISIFLEWKWSFLGKYSNKGGVDGWGGCKFKVLLSLSDAIAKGFCAYKVDSKSSTRTLQRRKDYYMHKYLLKFAEVAMENTC